MTTGEQIKRFALIERIDKAIAHLEDPAEGLTPDCAGCDDVVKLLKIMKIAAGAQAQAQDVPGAIPADYAESAK